MEAEQTQTGRKWHSSGFSMISERSFAEEDNSPLFFNAVFWTWHEQEKIKTMSSEVLP